MGPWAHGNKRPLSPTSLNSSIILDCSQLIVSGCLTELLFARIQGGLSQSIRRCGLSRFSGRFAMNLYSVIVLSFINSLFLLICSYCPGQFLREFHWVRPPTRNYFMGQISLPCSYCTLAMCLSPASKHEVYRVPSLKCYRILHIP